MNYVEGRYWLSFQSDNSIEQTDLGSFDSNYLFLEKLFQANKSGDLETYSKLFNQFISDPTIYGYFSYTEHPPSSCVQVFYPLCECGGAREDSLEKVHRGLYQAKCSCVPGKRYIGLRNAYEIALGRPESYCTFQISDLIEENKLSDDIFTTNPIIQWIENESPHINPLEKQLNEKYSEWVWPENI